MRSWMRAAVSLPLCLAFLVGCGGGSLHDVFGSTGSGSGGGGKNCGSGCNGGGGGGGGGGGNSGSGPAAGATPVTVTGGQTTTGVDIAVVAPVSNPTPNATFIGTGDLAAGIHVFNVGTVIHQSSTTTVAILGYGLASNILVGITGPADITMSNITSVRGTLGNPDATTFTASVSGSAALGARTVILQDANKDNTTFTGGLEVIP
jgi:hypothetical protein